MTDTENTSEEIIAETGEELRLSETDRLALELAKSQRLVANAEAKTALANTEKADLTYKYIVLQLYMKYGLNANDAIKESGEIIKGGAVSQG